MRTVGLAIVLVAAAAITGARAETPSYTADVVQSHPQGGSQKAKIFVAPQGMRMEFSSQGRAMVQIMLPAQGVSRYLDPGQKTYMEMKGPVSRQAPGSQPDNPCQSFPNANCTKLGVEKLGDANTEKWQVAAKQGNQSVMIWWDPERKMIRRQQFSDGRVMHTTLAGMVDYEGRKVERWTATFSSRGQKAQSAERLFDPVLGLAVKEQMPNGMMRSLHNIKVTQPDPMWFAVPAGYKKVDPPKPQQMQGGQQQRRMQQQYPRQRQQPYSGQGQQPYGGQQMQRPYQVPRQQ